MNAKEFSKYVPVMVIVAFILYFYSLKCSQSPISFSELLISQNKPEDKFCSYVNIYPLQQPELKSPYNPFAANATITSVSFSGTASEVLPSPSFEVPEES
ncbi:hypothetical protein M1307_00400 [Patescibacteria group bacterium]|nr:hypothetical protein [Patescibacteria group bacterium]